MTIDSEMSKAASAMADAACEYECLACGHKFTEHPDICDYDCDKCRAWMALRGTVWVWLNQPCEDEVYGAYEREMAYWDRKIDEKLGK